MNGLRRRVTAALVVLAVATPLAGCGERRSLSDRLVSIVERTEQLSAEYVYRDTRYDDEVTGRRGRATEVQGLREDDFRFKARVLHDGKEAFDEIVRDDALAMRFVDPTAIAPLVDQQALGSVDRATSLGADVLDVLASRRWVLDGSAAPSIAVGARTADDIGRDPVLDAFTALQYVEDAIRESAGVKEFDEDSLEPAYFASEDVFPAPEGGSGVRRYDLVRPSLPPAVDLRNRSDSSFPGTRHFRRMAVYVKDGRVIQVREVIDLRGKKLDQFIKYNRAVLRANDVPERFVRQFDDFVEQRPSDARAEVAYGRQALHALSANLKTLGAPSVLVRSMLLDFRQLGSAVVVDLPNEQVVEGNLDFLVVSDRAKRHDAGAGTTTTAAPGTTSP